MSRIIVLIVLLGIAHSGYSAPNTYNSSVLYLKMHNNKPFTAKIDGKVYTKAQDMLEINGLKPGKHLLRVMQGNTNSQKYSLQTVAKKGEKTELGTVVFHGYITISPKKVIFAFIDADQKFRVVKERATVTVSLPNNFLPNPNVLIQNLWHESNTSVWRKKALV